MGLRTRATGLQDFVTISDTSVDLSTFDPTCNDLLQSDISVAETLSLMSLEGQTISPESYTSPDEECGGNARWLFLGQPENILAAEAGDGKTCDTDEEGNLEIDFDKQKQASVSHVRRRLKQIKRALEEMQLCDMLISFGDSATPVHSLMFSLHDGFQKRKLVGKNGKSRTQVQQVDVYGDVTVLAFAAIMNYVYDGQCQFAHENLAEVVSAVEFFGLTSLDEQIVEATDKLLSDVVLLPIVFQGDTEHPLYDIAWSKLLQRFQVVAGRGDFVALEVAEICRLLGADGLAVSSELQVFTWAQQWLNAYRSLRIAHFVKVMKCVRFHFMTVDELAACQVQDPEMMKTKQIADLIETAYIARPFILANDLTFLEQFELAPPRNLAVLKRFSSFVDTKLGPRSERVTSQKQEELSYSTNSSLRSLSPISDRHCKSNPVPSISRKSSGRFDDVSSLKSVRTVPKDDGFMEPLDYYKCLSVSGKASSTSHSVQNSPSFSEMTFNNNGSLVTKRGGRMAHQTLNRAFERIYSEKSET